MGTRTRRTWLMRAVKWAWWLCVVIVLLLIEVGARMLTTPRPFLHDAGVRHAARLSAGRTMAYHVALPSSVTVQTPIVFVLHGVGDSSLRQLPFMHELAGHGVIAVAPDLLGHGNSAPIPLRFGDADGHALCRVLAELTHSTGSHGSVYVYGPSYGGSAALHFASYEPRVTRVALASTFSVLPNILRNYEGRLFGFVFPHWLEEAALWRASLLSGIDMHVRPVALVPALVQRGVRFVLLHGEADVRIPIREGEAIAQAAHARLVRVPGAGHDDVLAHDDAMDTLRAFLVSKE